MGKGEAMPANHTLRFEDDILTYWNKDDELIDNSEEVDPWLKKRSA